MDLNNLKFLTSASTTSCSWGEGSSSIMPINHEAPPPPLPPPDHHHHHLLLHLNKFPFHHHHDGAHEMTMMSSTPPSTVLGWANNFPLILQTTTTTTATTNNNNAQISPNAPSSSSSSSSSLLAAAAGGSNNNNNGNEAMMGAHTFHHHEDVEEEEEEEEEDEDEEEELGAVKEMMFKIAAMQPVEIDPSTIRKPKRRNVRISDDPQSVAARLRRERISEKIRILQRLVPGGTKMDTASMLDEAIRYVKFLKRHIRHLQFNHHHPPPPPPPPSVVANWPASDSTFAGNVLTEDPAAAGPMCLNHELR